MAQAFPMLIDVHLDSFLLVGISQRRGNVFADERLTIFISAFYEIAQKNV